MSVPVRIVDAIRAGTGYSATSGQKAHTELTLMSVFGRTVNAIRASYEELRRGADFPAVQLTRPDVPLALPAPEASQQLPQSSTAATPAGSAPDQSDIDQAWRQLTNLRERWAPASSSCTCLSSQGSMSISQA